MNTRPSLLALVLASALSACDGFSGKKSAGTDPADTDAERLRVELAAGGIHPLASPPAVSDALFELGQALFFDKILSGSQDVSCATCHLPEFYTGDGRTLPIGVGGIGFGPNRGGATIVPRNSPPLLALHLRRELFWDGRVQDLGGFVSVPSNVVLADEMRAAFAPGLELLAAQALLPPFARDEMRGYAGANDLADLGEDYTAVWAALLERLLAVPRYVELLRAAYPRVALQDFSFAHAANAIAGFEVRAFARTDSAFERFVRGDDAALTPEQMAGAREFFGPAGCVRCHSGSLFSDEGHHNIGLPQLGPGIPGSPVAGADYGRENATGRLQDRYAFRTASLLGVEQNGPYGHAGQFANLHDFVSHYRDAELSNRQYDISSNVFEAALVTMLVPNSDEVLASLDPLLGFPNDFDVDAVVTFLYSLTALEALELREVVPESVPSGLPIF